MQSGIEPRPPAPLADALTTMLCRGGQASAGIDEVVLLLHRDTQWIESITQTMVGQCWKHSG